jgi:hypothetical protein
MKRYSALGAVLVLAACTSSATDTPASSGVTLRVAFWDYTDNGITEQPKVGRRGAEDSWLPEIGRRLDGHAFSGLESGTTETFRFVPFGSDFVPFGSDPLEISVDVPITDALCPSGCVPDTLNFGIWDDYVAVWGVVESRVVDRSGHEHSPRQLLRLRLH